MQTAIQQIVAAIPSGCVFDSHYVIARLIREYSDQYLNFASGITAATNKTLAVHGKIGQEIANLQGQGFERLDHKSWSENIHGNPSDCTCWRRL